VDGSLALSPQLFVFLLGCFFFFCLEKNEEEEEVVDIG
jgi:hypothetical protein